MPSVPRNCAPFESTGRLLKNETFQAPAPRGLVFALYDDDGAWGIDIHPSKAPTHHYLDVTPPIQFRPHLYIGHGYVSAKESAETKRYVQFVTNETDYRRARKAIASYNKSKDPGAAGATLKTLGPLMKGLLTLEVHDYALESASKDEYTMGGAHMDHLFRPGVRAVRFEGESSRKYLDWLTRHAAVSAGERRSRCG